MPSIAPIRVALALAILASLASCVLPPRPDLAQRPGVVRHTAKPPQGGTQKWNPIWWFGNADDPQPPDWYRPGSRGRATLWQLRNPLHNFTFYVIGVADEDFLRYGSEPGDVFSRDGGWNWAVIQRGWLRLPFVSYQGRRVQFYALWRERGNFGLKLNRAPRRPPEDPPAEPARRAAPYPYWRRH
jgi:hypothetical protein